MIQLQDLFFHEFISVTQVKEAVNSVSLKINKDYKETSPVFLIVLNGAFFFGSDLIKQFDRTCEMSFIKVASYKGTKSSGVVSKVMGLDMSLKDRDVILVEDIVDSGNTIEAILKMLKQEQV